MSYHIACIMIHILSVVSRIVPALELTLIISGTGPEVIKQFFMLNSTEHEFFLLINVNSNSL